jgi:hypothetical protein
MRGTVNSADEEGLLGMDLLSDYVLVIDGPTPTLYLAKHSMGRNEWWREAHKPDARQE